MKLQIAKIIFHTNLAIMKKILDLIAFKTDKKSDIYKYYKKEVMDYFYNGLKKLFKQLEEEKILQKCNCNTKIRKGYSDCPKCGGSGYSNKNET